MDRRKFLTNLVGLPLACKLADKWTAPLVSRRAQGVPVSFDGLPIVLGMYYRKSIPMAEWVDMGPIEWIDLELTRAIRLDDGWIDLGPIGGTPHWKT